MLNPRIITAALATLAATAFCPPPAALADGMPFPPYQREMYETDQLAFIDHDADTDIEVMHILPMFRGDVTDFAWVVPTPSTPTVTESSIELFQDLSALSSPTYRYRDEFWGCNDSYDIVNAPSDGRVDITFHDVVGIYDVLVLSADNAGALADSLTAWGYLHQDNRDDVLPVLQDYVDDGWSFTAMRILEEEYQPYERYWYGGVDPVTFTFASEEIVYPMRISALGSDSHCDVILYVVSDHRTTFPGARTDYANRLSSSELSAIRNRLPDAGELLEEGDFITKLSRTYTPAEMVADLVLEPAPNNDEFKQVIYSGAPVTLGLLVAIGVGLKTLSRRRRRR